MRCTLTCELITLAIHKSLSLFSFGPIKKNIAADRFAMVDSNLVYLCQCNSDEIVNAPVQKSYRKLPLFAETLHFEFKWCNKNSSETTATQLITQVLNKRILILCLFAIPDFPC